MNDNNIIERLVCDGNNMHWEVEKDGIIVKSFHLDEAKKQLLFELEQKNKKGAKNLKE